LSQLKTGIRHFEPSALAAGFVGSPAASADGSTPKFSFDEALALFSDSRASEIWAEYEEPTKNISNND